MRAVAPVTVRTVLRARGPAVEPRRSQQRSGRLAFGERGAHRRLSLPFAGEVKLLEAEGRVKEKRGSPPLLHVQVFSLSRTPLLHPHPRSRPSLDRVKLEHTHKKSGA